MDRETQDLFENYFDLFSRPGWKQFVDNLEVNLQSVSRLDDIKTTEDLYRAKGAREVLSRIVNFKALIEQSYEEAKETAAYMDAMDDE